MQPERAILHVDMDAFYASVEMRDNPELRGTALIVGGTTGRGVVAAASYEVRRYGVHSAMPIARALKLCPHAVCVKPRMRRYQEMSAQVFEVFHEFTPLVAGLSLDEAFLDVTQSQSLKGDAPCIAQNIKQLILERTGLTASVGVAPNRLVAKIASDLDKPDGLTIVTPASINTVLDPLSVKRLPGLGRKKGDAVLAAGIATLGELRRASDAQLWPLFGHQSARMRERASGIDERAVTPDWDGRSVSAEETFRADIADVARLRSELLLLSDRTAARLRDKLLSAGCVTIKIRRHDFSTQTRQRRLTPHSNESRHLGAIALALLDVWLRENPGARLRLLGMGTSDLQVVEQQDMFSIAPPEQASALDATLDKIRSRFGTGALTRASGLRRRVP
ncbi:MAG: DNA polymerase IV [Steroidobacteraceae bacterium]